MCFTGIASNLLFHHITIAAVSKSTRDFSPAISVLTAASLSFSPARQLLGLPLAANDFVCIYRAFYGHMQELIWALSTNPRLCIFLLSSRDLWGFLNLWSLCAISIRYQYTRIRIFPAMVTRICMQHTQSHLQSQSQFAHQIRCAAVPPRRYHGTACPRRPYAVS